MANHELDAVEGRWIECPSFNNCLGACGGRLQLSSIPPGDPARGARNPRVLLVTSSPDKKSAFEGKSYSGPTDGRIAALFTDPAYGLEIAPKSERPPDVGQFLADHGIYRTSAVKCAVLGGDNGGGWPVIHECRTRHLDQQVAAMPNLGLIVPLGGVAIQSVMGLMQQPKVMRFVGSARAMVAKHPKYRVPVVCLPHPSPQNPGFNAPPPMQVFNELPSFGGLQATPAGAGTHMAKRGFRVALDRLRLHLDSLGICQEPTQ